MIICILVVSIITLYFSFLILFMCPSFFLFSFMSLVKGLLNLLLFKEPALSYCFASLYFIYFCSDHYDLFPLTNFKFSFLFLLVPSGLKLSCLFEIFLVSWSKLVLAINFLLKTLLLHHIEFELLLFFFFNLSPSTFWFLLLSSSEINWLFSNILFSFHMFLISAGFFPLVVDF